MNRYNRSFVGLMEMCSDGEWVKHSDAKGTIGALEEKIRVLENNYAELATDFDLLQNDNSGLLAQNNTLREEPLTKILRAEYRASIVEKKAGKLQSLVARLKACLVTLMFFQSVLLIVLFNK